MPNPIALPAWADPSDFSEPRPGTLLILKGRFEDRAATFVYKGARLTVVVGTRSPWPVIKLHVRKVDRGEIRIAPEAARPERARSLPRRKRAVVTYEFLFSRMQLARRRAEKKGLPFGLTTADLYALGDKQGWRCALTGIPFDCTNREAWNNPYTLAIDRLDNRDGYTLGNIRLVLHAMNVAIGPWGEDAFAEIAERFLAHRAARVPDGVPHRGPFGPNGIEADGNSPMKSTSIGSDF